MANAGRVIPTLLASGLFYIGLAHGENWIVRDGKPTADIVIAAKPPRSVRLASWELQNYLRKITGATLPIVHEPGDASVHLYVGASKHTEKLGVTNEGLENGAYRMVSGKDWLALIGTDTDFQPIEPYARTRSQRGSEPIKAAWDKIAGGKWGHPAGNAFKMLFRNINQHFRDKGKDEPLHLWAFDQRGSYNAVCGFLRHLGLRWYMPGELGEVVPQRPSIPLMKIDERAVPAFPVRDCNIRIGIHDPRVAIWGMRLGMRQPHGFGWAHGLNGVTSREEMKREQPEYYALFAGQRATGYRSGGKQCLSAPGLLKETVAYTRAVVDHYHHKVISIQPSDGYTSLCQCELCKGKDSPERPYRGRLSNYVWGFTLAAANELAKTHPQAKVSNMAYNLARLPPTNIDKLPDNVMVALVGGRRPTEIGPEQRKEIRQLRDAWIAKTDQKLVNFENYPLTARGYWLPAFTAHTNARSINAIKGTFLGENIQPSAHRFMDAAAFNSYQFYFTFRMYWGDKNQDVEPMLEEFYTLFYGPARTQMKAFFEYCEVHFPEMRKSKATADRALSLFAEARKQVEKDSIYDLRLAVMADYLDSLADRSEQIAKEQKRENVPVLRMWRDAKVKIDGRLDDEFWKKMPTRSGGRLRDLQTGRKPMFGTSFKVAWGHNAIYFGIRCEDMAKDTVKIGATRHEDQGLWYGDCVEILLETEENSYYQIAIGPSGAVVDLNRANRKKDFRWASQVESKTHVGKDYWTVEARIPVIEKSNDPYHQVIGRRPTESLPWYFNVCRQRLRDNSRELSAFSPTGDTAFHVLSKFAKLHCD